MEKVKSQRNNQANGLVRTLKKTVLNWRNFNKILFVLAVILGVFCLASANDLAVKGFTLSDLKQQRAKAADDNKKLELRVMALSSYNAINEKIARLKMTAVGNIDYISENAAVAKK